MKFLLNSICGAVFYYFSFGLADQPMAVDHIKAEMMKGNYHAGRRKDIRQVGRICF
jgi:hypothetical protein